MVRTFLGCAVADCSGRCARARVRPLAPSSSRNLPPRPPSPSPLGRHPRSAECLEAQGGPRLLLALGAQRRQHEGKVATSHVWRGCRLRPRRPDYVHVMSKGQIVRSGGPELALELEKDGYAFLDRS